MSSKAIIAVTITILIIITLILMYKGHVNFAFLTLL